MAKTGCIISHEGIEYLCGLIRDLSNVSEGIDNINIADNKTFSSTKIDLLLRTLKEDCNKYSENLCSNLSRLELKLVTNENEITQSNILYLFKPDGQDSYNQYVVIEGNKILLGTCDVSMTDYYTITQADNRFALQTSLDTTNTEVTNIKTNIGTLNDLTTTDKTSIVNAINTLNTNKEEKSNKVTTLDSTSTDTQYPSALAVKTELDKKIDKTSIVTSVDIMSTEKQIPSASAFYNECQGKPVSINDINTYGTKILRYPVGRWRTNTHKTASLFSDLPVPSAFFIDIFSLNNDKNENPWNASWAYNFYVFYPLGANGYYIRSIQSGKSAGEIDYDSGWQKICTTKVADVGVTVINSFENETFIKPSGNGLCSYYVKNGQCYITLETTVVATNNNFTRVLSGLPKPKWSVYSNSISRYMVSGGSKGLFQLRTDGNLYVACYYDSTGESLYVTLSYPVENS